MGCDVILQVVYSTQPFQMCLRSHTEMHYVCDRICKLRLTFMSDACNVKVKGTQLGVMVT